MGAGGCRGGGSGGGGGGNGWGGGGGVATADSQVGGAELWEKGARWES